MAFGSGPKLMFSAPTWRLVASTIAASMLDCVKSVFSITSLQLNPAPAIPIPLLVFAHASEATWVPWPTWSVPAGPVELNTCSSIGATRELRS